jgi:hypothetical protein
MYLPIESQSLYGGDRSASNLICTYPAVIDRIAIRQNRANTEIARVTATLYIEQGITT